MLFSCQEIYWGGTKGVIAAAPDVPPERVHVWKGKHAHELDSPTAPKWAVGELLRMLQ